MDFKKQFNKLKKPLMSKNQINRINKFFKTISYIPNGKIDIVDILCKLLLTLSKCVIVLDANDLLMEYLFVLTKEEKINKIFSSEKFNIMNIEEFNGKMDIDIYSESCNSSVLTNLFNEDNKDFDILFPAGDRLFETYREEDRYAIYDDYAWYLLLKDDKAFIYFNEEETIVLKYSKNGINIELNKTNLIFKTVEEQNICVYHDNDQENNLIGMIDFDSLHIDTLLVTALIESFIAEDEYILLIGLAITLLFLEYNNQNTFSNKVISKIKNFKIHK